MGELWFRKPLSTVLMKNWAVALWGSLVRAMATVYLSFFRPFLASFSMGAWVSFCFMSAVMPPPWTMKFLITRWNTVPL